MRAAAIASLLVLSIIALSSADTSAQQPSSDDIVRALVPKPTPSGDGAAPIVRDMRGIQVVPPEQQKKSSIDLYINFKFDSADLEPEALLVLRTLGTALRDPQLKDAKIMIIGHTDATGSADYNAQLSQRRADSVRKLLIANFSIDGGRLVAVGRGKQELKNSTRPDDGINRRVEIRNVTAN